MPESKSSCRTSLYVRRKYDFLFRCVIVAMMEVGSVSNIGLMFFFVDKHVWVSWLALLAIYSLQVGNLTIGDAWVEILLQNIFVCEEKIRFRFPMHHYGCVGSRLYVKHWPSVVPRWRSGLGVVISFTCYLHFAGGKFDCRGCWVKILLQNIFVYEEKIRFHFLVCHCGCDGGGLCVDHCWSGKRKRHHYSHASLVVVVTYKDGLQEDFDRSQYWKIPIIQTVTFLIVYTVGGLWTVLASLNFYLTCLTTRNVFLIGVFQYIFLRFFDTILCAVNLANIVLHCHSWLVGWCLLLGLLDAAYCCLIQLCRVEVLQL